MLFSFQSQSGQSVSVPVPVPEALQYVAVSTMQDSRGFVVSSVSEKRGRAAVTWSNPNVLEPKRFQTTGEIVSILARSRLQEITHYVIKPI